MTTQYNVVTYGNLTNTNGVLSDFSVSNYATLPKKFAPSGDSFEIVIKFKLNSIDTSQDTYPTLLASSNTSTDWDGYNFQVYEGALYFELVQNDEAVVIVHDNTKVLSANVDYYAKAIFDGSAYTTYISTNGTTWTQQATVTSSTYYQPTNINITYLGRQNYADITNALNGSIDLNESYIDINNIRWWQGVTSTSNVQTRIQLRHDTAANWTSVNPVLLEGEVGIETDTLKQKVGDGSTAWNNLPYDAGSTALQSITSTDVTNALGYTPQTQLVSGTNIKTVNNTSVLGSGNIAVGTVTSVNNTQPDANGNVTVSVSGGANTDLSNLSSTGEAHFLKNTATGTNSLTVSGTATSATSAVNIGATSTAEGGYSVAVGYYAASNGARSTSIGYGARIGASTADAIQIGNGTNSTAKSLSVGFYNTANYTLLDGATGYIPNARINMDSSPTSSSANTVTSGGVYTALASKQDTLVSGTSIKTINSTSLLGSGNIDLPNMDNTTFRMYTGAKYYWYNNNTTRLWYAYTASDTPSVGDLVSAYDYGSPTIYRGTVSSVSSNSITISSNVTVINGMTFYRNSALDETGYYKLVDDEDTELEIKSSYLADTTLSNVSSIDSSSVVKTALDAKVDKSGDTMTGALELRYSTDIPIKSRNMDYTFGTPPQTSTYTAILQGRDSNNVSMMGISSCYLSNGEHYARLYSTKDTNDDDWSIIDVGYDLNGNKFCRTNVTPSSVTDNTTKIATTAHVINVLKAMYPVGAIFIGTTSTCPMAQFFGTWSLVAGDKVLQGSSSNHSANSTIAAGLPNITGSMSGLGTLMKGSGTPSASGALSITKGTSDYAGYSKSDGNLITKISFSAKDSNSIYSNSSTVQPPAYVVNVWRRTA